MQRVKCMSTRLWTIHQKHMGAAETKPPTHRDLIPKFGPNIGEMYLDNTFNILIDFLPLRFGIIKSRFHYFKSPKLQIS